MDVVVADHVNVTLYIRSTRTNVSFVDTKLTFFDCTRHVS